MNPVVQDIIVLFKPALFNIYFALIALPIGFPFAILLALGCNSTHRIISRLAKGYIYAFRGSPLFIQFFLVYSVLLAFNLKYWKPMGISEWVLHPLFIAPLVLILNTAAYSAQIFYGALKTVPKGEIEAAKAIGMGQRQIFKTAIWPNMLRIAWPAYTNEAIFLFQSTVLVYFTLPVIDGQKDLLRKATELFETDYQLFLHFSVAGLYFLAISLVIFYIFNYINKRLNRHLTLSVTALKVRPNYIR